MHSQTDKQQMSVYKTMEKGHAIYRQHYPKRSHLENPEGKENKKETKKKQGAKNLLPRDTFWEVPKSIDSQRHHCKHQN